MSHVFPWIKRIALSEARLIELPRASDMPTVVRAFACTWTKRATSALSCVAQLAPARAKCVGERIVVGPCRRRMHVPMRPRDGGVEHVIADGPQRRRSWLSSAVVCGGDEFAGCARCEADRVQDLLAHAYVARSPWVSCHRDGLMRYRYGNDEDHVGTAGAARGDCHHSRGRIRRNEMAIRLLTSRCV